MTINSILLGVRRYWEFGRKVPYPIARNDSKGFLYWKGLKTAGNVYGKWETYLTGKTGSYTQVGPDWVFCEVHHGRDRNNAIQTYDSHPRWFNRWVRGNGVGKYGTRFDPNRKNT